MKTLEERKKEIQKFIRNINRGDTKMKKSKNEKIKKNIKIHEKLKRRIPQEYSSSYKQASRQAKKLLLLKQKQYSY